MFYPSNVPPYNRFRNRAKPISLDDFVTLAVKMPVQFRPFFIGAFSVLTEVNAWAEASGITPESMVDIANNEVVFMDFCGVVADCISNDPAVQQALQTVINQFGLGNPSSEAVPAQAPPNSLLQAGCDNDSVYGACVAIEDYVHSVGRDFVEVLVSQGTVLTAVARAVSYIPILGDLPILNDLQPLVDWILTNGLVAYDAGYNTTIRQNNICFLFESGCGSCDLTVQDVVNFYALESGVSYIITDPFRALASLAVGTTTAEAFTFAVKGIVVAALAAGSPVGDLTGLQSFEAVAASGDPDGDWALFCNPCPTPPCSEDDFSTGPDGWVVASNPNGGGVWVPAIQGWRSTVRNAGGPQRSVGIEKSGIALSNVTAVEIDLNVSWGNFSVGRANNARFRDSNNNLLGLLDLDPDFQNGPVPNGASTQRIDFPSPVSLATAEIFVNTCGDTGDCNANPGQAEVLAVRYYCQ